MTGAITYRDACNLFDELIHRVHEEMYSIVNLHRLIAESATLGFSQLSELEIQRYEDFLPEGIKLGIDQDILDLTIEDLNTGAYKQRIPDMTAVNLDKAQQFNASAILIYTHAHFEICLDNLLSISTYSHRDEWLKEISNQTLKVEQLGSQEDLWDLLTQKIQDKLNKIEREGVEIKMKLLFRLFKPLSEQKQPLGYQYDLDMVLQIDGLRHKVVHVNPLVYDTQRLKDDVHYLTMTVMYLTMILLSRVKVSRIPKKYNQFFDSAGNKIENGANKIE